MTNTSVTYVIQIEYQEGSWSDMFAYGKNGRETAELYLEDLREMTDNEAWRLIRRTDEIL